MAAKTGGRLEVSGSLAALLAGPDAVGFEWGGYRFRRARTREELECVYRLRYEVYCEEEFIEPGDHPERRFEDAFDADSDQLMVLDPDDQLVGTTRFVRPSERGLPTEHLFDFAPPSVPRERIGEFGRLAISKPHRGGARVPMLGLVKMVYGCIRERQITHVMAFLPPKLAASYSALGLVSHRLSMKPTSDATRANRYVMRRYFARQEIHPVLFSIEEMEGVVGVGKGRETS